MVDQNSAKRRTIVQSRAQNPLRKKQPRSRSRNPPECLMHRSDYSKQVRGQFIRICLKIAKSCRLYLDIFSCVKINVFRPFFAFTREMHIRCDNQYTTEADGGSILGQPMLFESMGICVSSPAHECQMRGSLVYLFIVKYFSIFF